MKRSSAYLLVLLVAALLLTGCGDRERTPQAVAEWGRAKRVGAASISTRVGLAVAADGAQVALAWPARSPGETADRIHLLTLDGDGNTLVDQDLDFPVESLKGVQLLAVGGRLHLVWAAGQARERALWHFDLGPLDRPITSGLEPEPISPEGSAVDSFQGVRTPTGELVVLWVDRSGNLSLWPSREGWSGLVFSGVMKASLALEGDGGAWLAWTAQESISRLAIYLASFDLESWRVGAPTLVATVAVPGSASADDLRGPVISLEEDQLTVSWTQRVETLISVSEKLYAASIPLGVQDVAEIEPRLIGIPAVYPPRTGPAEEGSSYGGLAGLQVNATRSASVNRAPATLGDQTQETVLAEPVLLSTRTRQEYQPAVIYLRDGEPLGYQALTWTDHPSLNPALAADVEGQLYVAWSDATGEAYNYPVYLATTARPLNTSWSRLTGADYLAIVGDLVNRIASGVFFAPLAAIWLLVPFPFLFMMVIWYHGDLYGNRGRWVLVLSLGIYWAAKYLFTFEILTYLPNLGQVPSGLGQILIFLTPVVILMLSCLVVARTYLRRVGDELTPMKAYLAIALVDWVLSLSVYAIGYFE